MFFLVMALRSPDEHLRNIFGGLLAGHASFALAGIAVWGHRTLLRHRARFGRAPERSAESARGGRESVG
jgi:hypothetical protein